VVNRNIVVGIGLDYENEEYTLYTQVVLPKNGGVASGGGNNYITLKAKAKNIDLAIDLIEKEQGVILSFAQATILILGKSMVENGDLQLVDTFFMDDRVHDNLLIVMAEEKAEDVMNANVAAGEVASLQLVRQLRPTKAPLGVSAISLQEYARNSKNLNKINYMPMISVEKTEPSTDQSKEDMKEADKFTINKTAMVDEKGLQCILDEELTKSFNFAKKTMQDGVLTVEDGELFSVHIISSKANMEFDLDKMESKVKIKLKTIRTESRNDNGKATFKMNEEEEKRLIKTIDRGLQNLFKYGIDNNVDILNINDGFWKKYPKKSSQVLAENFYKSIKLTVEVKVSQV
ncbi:MAG: hypothetical protein K2P12_02190, partial [Clostridia bacterium]|nr:hypothetical protein [Clostridia bacterium]